MKTQKTISRILAGILFSSATFSQPVPGRVEALTCTHVTFHSALLNGTLDEFVLPAIASFEYGLTETFGNEIPANPENISDSLLHDVTASVSGLQSNTFYYYRLKAKTGDTTLYSATRKLFTGAPETPNWDFQNWSNETVVIPNEWSIMGTAYERVSNNAGGYALKISNLNAANLGIIGYRGFTGGEPFNARPDSVHVVMDYYVEPNDTCFLLVHTYSGPTIILSNIIPITGSSNGIFNTLSFPLSYSSSLFPDSIFLAFTSFNIHSDFRDTNNYIAVDNISFGSSSPVVYNADFETWFEYSYERIEEWKYGNYIWIDPLNPDSSTIVRKVIFNEPNDYAVELSNTIWHGQWLGMVLSNNNQLIDQRGAAYPVAGKHQVFSGYYKYLPAAGDTANLNIALFNNGVQIGRGWMAESNTVSEFTPFDIFIDYFIDNLIPDSAAFNATSGVDYASGKSKLYLDKFSFDGFWEDTTSASIAIPYSSDAGLRLYPNPAADKVFISLNNSVKAGATLNVYNATGQVLRSEILCSNQQQINVSDLSSGMYLIEVSTPTWSEKQKLIIKR